MPSYKELKTRIQSVENTKKITKAMQLVAASKFTKAQANILNARPYASILMNIIFDLTNFTDRDSHRLLEKRPIKKAQLLVLTSDKGLCGAFNTNIMRTAENFYNEQESKGIDIQLSCIGRKCIQYFEKNNFKIKQKYYDVINKPSVAVAPKIADDVIKDFISNEHDAFYLAYNEFKSALQQKPVIEELLPIVPTKGEDPVFRNRNFLFEPSKPLLLDQILTRYFQSQIFRAILESVASEHGARMAAMDNATKNASDLIEKLQLEYNKLRQASITTEMLEIVGGAEALNN